MHPSSYLLSVDLGTSHAVAVLRWPDGRTRPLLFDGQPVLPVGVYCDESGELHVGRDAVRLSAVSPDRFEPNPKRQVAQGSVLLADREVGVAAMFAAALRRIAAVCSQSTGVLPETVLTCPSSWSGQRREVLEEAAAQAGFGPVRLVTEPVAAAHYYRGVLGREIGAEEALAVVDFGAGTVDVAVLAADDGGGLAIAAEGGVADFGGVDVDAAIVDHLRAITIGGHPQAWAAIDDPRTGSQRRGRLQLWTDVRETKEMLSRFTVAPVGVPGIEAGLHLTRTELDAISRPLLEPVIDEVVRVRDAAEAAGHRLGAVFLVGGASRMPLAANLIHHALDVAPVVIEQPELAVAEGAAVASAPVGDGTSPAAVAEPESSAATAAEYAPVPVETPPAAAVEPATVPLPPPPPRSVRGRKRIAAVAAALLALALVGASALFNWEPWQAGGTGGGAPYAEALTGTADAACPEGLAAPLDAPGALYGPHFTSAPTCLTILAPEDASAAADLLGEVPALTGSQRLAIVHFTTGDANPTDQYTVHSAVTFGDQTWELDGVPAADAVYAAVVDADAPLQVAVTDAERTQTLDLATGQVADPVAAYYHGELAQREFVVEATLSFATVDDSWFMDGVVYRDHVAVSRSVFSEDLGWLCEPDEAVLTAVFEIRTYSAEYDQDWPFDAAQAVRVQAGDQTVLPQVTAEEVTRAAGDHGDDTWVAVGAVFTVPADLAEFAFEFDLQDSAYDRGLEKWFHASESPVAQSYGLDFTAA